MLRGILFAVPGVYILENLVVSQFRASISTILPSVNLQWLTKDTMERQTSRYEPMEDAWLFSVAISWGKKMNFSLCAICMAVFADDHRTFKLSGLDVQGLEVHAWA